MSRLLRCTSLRSLEIITHPNLELLEPILINNASSLETLRMDFYDDANARTFARLLPSLRSLKTFKILFAFTYNKGEVEVTTDTMIALIRALPPTVSSLSMDFISSPEIVHELALSINRGSLPDLEELVLSRDNREGSKLTETVADCMRQALIVAGEKLRKLFLDFNFDMTSRMLGLDQPNATPMALNHLKEFRVEYLTDGCLEVLVHHMFEGWLPELEVFNAARWYKFSKETTRMMFRLIHCRRLQIIPEKISFGNGDKAPALVKEMMVGLSQPLELKMTCRVEVLQIHEPIDEETIQLFTLALASQNLGSIRHLEFRVDKACSEPSFGALGRYLNHDFLPYLKNWTPIFYRASVAHWEAFFRALPPSGLNQLERLIFWGWGDEGSGDGRFSCFCQALANVDRQMVFKGLFDLRLHSEMEIQTLQALSAVLTCGALPSLRLLQLTGKTFVSFVFLPKTLSLRLCM